MSHSVIQHIKAALAQSYSYTAYQKLIADLLAKGESTTAGWQGDFIQYSELGLQRMHRWDKKINLTEEQLRAMAKITTPQTWIVIAEGWCGDAAHSLPVINKLAEANSLVDLRIVLREQQPDLMNDFLTNGGKSIPKLILFDSEKETVLGDWGPRPAPAQDLFLASKASGESHEEFAKKSQIWYNSDKGQTAIKEILALI